MATDLSIIQSSWFAGSVWCKAFSRKELARAAPHGSRAHREIADALLRDDAGAILVLAVSCLLLGEMKENSTFNVIEGASWTEVPREVARERARELAARDGCEVATRALAWFMALEGRSFVLDAEVAAVGVLTSDVVAFFFEAV